MKAFISLDRRGMLIRDLAEGIVLALSNPADCFYFYRITRTRMKAFQGVDIASIDDRIFFETYTFPAIDRTLDNTVLGGRCPARPRTVAQCIQYVKSSLINST